MTERTLFDPGLQPERTALAWRRTGLAVAVGAAVAVRVLAQRLGHGGIGIGALGMILAGLLLLGSTRRAQRTQTALRRDGHLGAGPSGYLIAMVCLTCTAAGVAALALIVTGQAASTGWVPP